ncbi:MAG TPA: RluA family pseudouridine synthase [Vicinamibacteria bacterium]|nr:RluA family pseudouridine synthase [Vicinamibacteria bacterium]
MSDASRLLVVDEAGTGQRLDAWLAAAVPELSRARIQTLIGESRVTLGGHPARASARVRAGQEITLSVPAPLPAEPEPEDIPLAVVYEDEDLLVVDKPAGLVVHPGPGTPRGTLVNALLGQVRDLSGIGGVLRPGIVHRLDKGTSGLLLVAKTDAAHRDLALQFSGRSVEKEYLALVLGVPRARTGAIDAPIGRDPRDRKRMSVSAPRGREARSTFAVVESFDGAALLRVRIHTGRTHQIRVHLSSLGHPVAGDATYGGTRTPSSRAAAARAVLQGLARPALHAARLAFRHPRTGERLSFESALPPDLEGALAALRAAAVAKMDA